MGDIAAGPGWVIDGQTLLPRIVDLTAFRRGMASDPLRDVLESLWSGRPDDAAALLRAQRPTLRVRALQADCHLVAGRVALAVADYGRLVNEATGTPQEAVIRQHYGKALFSAGRYADAAEQFARALELREQAGADETRIASSRQALAVARRAAGGET